MVSPPEFHYRKRTLTLPVINVTGPDRLDDTATVRRLGTASAYPDASEGFTNPVPEGREVVVAVTSRYYRGWGSYFERRTDGDVTYDHDNRTATVSLTVPIEESFENAVAATGTVTRKNNGRIEGGVEEGATRPSADGRVEAMIDRCESGGCTNITSTGTFTNGTYYADGDVDFGDSTLFDTSGGNVSIVVDGDISFGGSGGPGTEDHAITGGNKTTLYLNGTLDVGGNAGVNSDGEASDLLTYVHSSVDTISISGTAQYRGLIYAPGTDLGFDGGGKCGPGKGGCEGNLVGSVVAQGVDVGNAVVKREGDITLSVVFTGEASITYLHVSESRVAVTG
jgi:hypothetical protein